MIREQRFINDARIVVELVDARGVRVVDDRAVTLTVVEGDGVFPSGLSITLAPETHSLWGGAGAIEMRSYVPGTQRIRATAEGLSPAELAVTAVGPRKAPRVRRLPPPACAYCLRAPAGAGGDLAGRVPAPVSVSSAEPRFEGGNATNSGSGTFWRAASRDPEAWITADLEFH